MSHKQISNPNPEIFSEDFAYFVDSGTTDNLWTILPHDNEVLRPLVDINHLVDVMKHVKNNPDEAKEKAEAGHEFIMKNMTWRGSIIPQWLKLLDEAEQKLRTAQTVKLGGSKSSLKI